MSQWKEKKLRWCCKHRGIGCGMHQELPPAFATWWPWPRGKQLRTATEV